MAHVFPKYAEIEKEGFPSGEVRLYRELEKLDDKFHVFHSVSWITKSSTGGKDGETDFLVCHPDKGILVIEVKGGRIAADYRTGTWQSTDQNGRVHKIKDPFRQALNAKFNVLQKLKEHPDWKRNGNKIITLGHSVFFPDVDTAAALKGPNAPIDIIGDRTAFSNLQGWVENTFAFWAERDKNFDQGSLGPVGLSIIEKVFARVVTAKPLLSKKIEFEEEIRLKLTKQQVAVLDNFSKVRRAVISGGAGTGKTVLAVEKARRLAQEGFKTLLTCYNVPLSEHLEQVCESSENLHICGFHKLCRRMVAEAKKHGGHDFLQEIKSEHPDKDEWTYHAPNALALALDVVELSYDAIVVDEGQDFGEEFWLPVELMLSDSRTSPLYIFQDENQDIYARVSSFPADMVPLSLTFNCRNTQKIHSAAYKFYNGQEVNPPDVEGSEIIIIEGVDAVTQAKRIRDYVSRLLTSEKISAEEITVLIADSIRRQKYEKVLKSTPLHSEYAWNIGVLKQPNTISVETVARFKGLESTVIIVWGFDELRSDNRNEVLYVGLSRAKSVLAICGNQQACKSII